MTSVSDNIHEVAAGKTTSAETVKFSSPRDFSERSRQAVRSFLQTVVVIDDQARFGPTSEAEAATATAVQTNQESDEWDAEEGTEGVSPVVPNDVSSLIPPEEAESTETLLAHDLDAQKIINLFAHEELVCAVLKPYIKNDEEVLSSALRAASLADAFIVDWQLFELGYEKGQSARKLIREVIEADANKGGRLRLIIVYTGETDILDIAGKIENSLQQELGYQITRAEAAPVLTSSNLRIVVLAKEISDSPLGEYRVSFNDLPARVIQEYAEMTTGLVTNTALRALSRVREETHTLLAKFHSGMDAPFINHRIFIRVPDEAKEQLLELIAHELYAIMQCDQVLAEAGGQAIEEWFDTLYDENSFSYIKDIQKPTKGSVQVQKDRMRDLVMEGINDDLHGTGIPIGSALQKLTYILSKEKNAEKARLLDEEFAKLTILKSWYDAYNSKTPILMLGAVLYKEEEIEVDGETESEEKKKITVGSYWLCLQPPCDSVGVQPGAKLKFALLPLEKVTKKFEIVVPMPRGDSDSGNVTLKLAGSLANCENVYFDSKDGCVSAEKDGHGRYTFIPSSPVEARYFWLADLKFEVAQSVVNKLSAHFSRVGLNKSEWLRQS